MAGRRDMRGRRSLACISPCSMLRMVAALQKVGRGRDDLVTYPDVTTKLLAEVATGDSGELRSCQNGCPNIAGSLHKESSSGHRP